MSWWGNETAVRFPNLGIEFNDLPRGFAIAGYHWQSDVDAGRMAGTVLYQLIRNHERFIGQLARARAEFAEKTGGVPDMIGASNTMQRKGSAKIYRIDGTSANESDKGIVIANGQKVVKR